MASNDFEVPVRDAASHVTMTVRIIGMSAFMWRLWCVRCLLSVVGWISPIKIEIEESGAE